MEEINSSENLEREILEDARKKAERLLKSAEEDANRIARERAAAAEAARAALEVEARAEAAAFRDRLFATVPLEKARERTALLDARMRTAVAKAVRSLDSGEYGRFALSELERAVAVTGPGSILEAGRDIAPALAEAARSSAPLANAEIREAPEGGRGVSCRSPDGKRVFALDEDSVAALLLDRRRADLLAAAAGRTP